MESCFKVTTNGRRVLAHCMTHELPYRITRVAFGSGMIDEDSNLADQHELVQYVAEGSIGERKHEDDHLYITIRYENVQHPEVPTFYLAEFILYAADPVTGEETDFLYGTLGDYIQPVPAYRTGVPATSVEYPLVIVISSDLEVSVSAPAGLVTHADLHRLIDALGTRQQPITIPADGWEPAGIGGYLVDIPLEGITAKLIPRITFPPDGYALAGYYGLGPCETQDGVLRIWSRAAPADPIPAILTLAGDASGYVTVGDGSTSGGSTDLPPATRSTLGGVKVGDGLSVTHDGTLSVNTATDAEVNEVLDGALAPDSNK